MRRQLADNAYTNFIKKYMFVLRTFPKQNNYGDKFFILQGSFYYLTKEFSNLNEQRACITVNKSLLIASH